MKMMSSKSVLFVLFAAVCVFSFVPSSVEGLTQAALRCAAGSAPSLTTCRAPSTATTPIAGSGHCCTCSPGSYSSDGVTCKRCVSGLVALDGVDLSQTGAQCFCLPGFGDYDSVAMVCRRCPINTYSFKNHCVQCAANTFAAAQSTSCGPVVCPSDSYLPPGGSTIANCTRCKFGTAGQSCSTVQGCKCQSGYAGFDKNTAQCQQCATNSIAIYADMTKQDETVTVCAPCPQGTIASGDGRTCNTPATGVISTQLVATSTPFPTNPIPTLACSSPQGPPTTPGPAWNPSCLNGFTYQVTITGAGGSTVPYSAMVTLSNGRYYQSDYYTSPLYTFNHQLPVLLFADAVSKNVVAMLMPGTYETFVGGNSNYGYVGFGKTCDQFNALYQNQYGNSVCIMVTQSVDTDIGLLLAALNPPINLFTDTTFSMKLKFQCAAAPAFISCPANLLQFSIFDVTQAPATTVITLNVPDKYFSVSGDGTSKFSDKLIGFVDSNNNMQLVLAKSDSTDPTVNSMITGDATNSKFGNLIGKTCTVGSTVAACIPISMESFSLSDLMNSVSAGAINANYKAFFSCPA